MIEVLCIETHPLKAVVAGNTYPLLSDKCPCNCKAYNVGIKSPLSIPVLRCSVCGAHYRNEGVWWILAKRFGEIGTEDEHSTYEKVEELCDSNK